MEIPDRLTCLLRNLCAGQEATVRTGHGTTNRFQTGKGVHQGCMLSPCLFNLYAEYIMQNARKESKELFGFTKSWTWLSNWTDWENCCCYSVAKSYLTPCDRMDCSTPGFPALHYFLEFAQTMSLSQWCHPNISSSVTLFSSCRQSFPASGSFPISRFFASGGWSIGSSASESVLLVNIQGWFPLGLTALISLLSKGLSTVFSSTTVQKHHFFGAQSSLWSNSHICTWLLEKPYLWL